MSGQDTLIVCPEEEAELVDTFAIAIGVLTLIGSIIGYFVQQSADRKAEAEAKVKEDEDRDRQMALERAREQLSVLIGPMHRLWKTQTTILMAYRHQFGGDYKFDDYPKAFVERGRAYWMKNLPDDYLQPFIEDPYSYEAVMYRNFVTRRLQPIWTRIRELVLNHMSDLADMPTQEEWLQRYTQDDLKSPHTGSININVIFDSYTAYTYEFDDIVASWAEEDFRRMQPSTLVPFLICNVLVDLLYEKAKDKEAKYNKHVSVHKNTAQASMEEQARSGAFRNLMDKAKDTFETIEEQMVKAKDAIEEQVGKAKDAIEVQMGKPKDADKEEMSESKYRDEEQIGEDTKGSFEEHVRKEAGEA